MAPPPNIEHYNSVRRATYEAAIDGELVALRKLKIRFARLGALAAYLQGKTGINRTTLTRPTSAYRHMLLKFLDQQPGAASFVDEASAGQHGLRSKIALQSTEVGRLKRRIRQLELQLEQATQPNCKSESLDAATAYILVCQLMHRAETFVVDRSKSTILDLASPPGQREVCRRDRVRPFLHWVSTNKELPIVATLKIR